jgi:hypothetical protein
MTLLTNEDTLSAESKALLVISKHVQQWQTRTKVLQLRKADQSKAGEVAAREFSNKLKFNQLGWDTSAKERRYSFQTTELGGEIGKQKKLSPSRHELMQQRHQSKLVLEKKLQNWKEARKDAEHPLAGQLQPQRKFLGPMELPVAVGLGADGRRASRRISNSLQAQATTQAALAAARISIDAELAAGSSYASPSNESLAEGPSNAQAVMLARVEGVEGAVKAMRGMFEQSLSAAAQQQQQHEAFSKLVSEQLVTMQQMQGELLGKIRGSERQPL